ncbi:S8 family serine peptidase [Streptomyces wedmorensis]|uniref:S8 family serine peptidase n=1 Tax=Streptomyces wedmorensis TaxID=43759 RepID=UPI00379810A9
MHRFVSGLVSMALAVSTLVMTGTAGQAAAQEAKPHDKIRPALQEQLKDKGKADFWVRLDERADLTEAARIRDWEERGTAVARVLRETAEASQADVRAKLDHAHVGYRSFWATNAIHVTGGSLQMAEQLATETEVESLWQDVTYTAPEPEAGRNVAEVNAVEWGLAGINADEVWEKYGDKGAGITVANIDTGVQYDHPALVKQYRGTRADGSFDHNYNWFDAAKSCAGEPCDKNGHGTHTMGTMAGDDGAGNHIGVAPEVKWIAANGCCPSATALVESGQWMLEPTDLSGRNPDAGKRPNIINNSFGSSVPSNDPFLEDISLAWTASGIFGVWANGNVGSACRTSGSPGSRTVNYSVGAYDSSNTIASFSSRGSGQDGETKPNISAPGVNVRSSVPGSGYASYSGTSMATPHVAGAIALLWSAAPSLRGDVAATKELLDDTGIDSPDDQCGGTDDDNNVFGEGRLDALALVSSAPGRINGVIKDAATGKPVAGAAVATGGTTVSSDKEGRYKLQVPDGDHTLTVKVFGYADSTVTVQVQAGANTSRDIDVTPLPRVHVRGKVTDGSGHGWPLYAKVSVPGDPESHWTDPSTGAYDLLLPAGRTFELTADPDLPGYPPATRETAVGSADLDVEITAPVDAQACNAAGYAVAYDGLNQFFDSPTAPDGWTVTDAIGNGEVWRFDDHGARRNRTTGSGLFATVNSLAYNQTRTQDTTLTAPVVDLGKVEKATLQFNTYLIGTYGPSHAYVDLSVDNGQNWQTVWERTSSSVSGSQQTVAVPQAAGKSQVQVRFRYTGGGRNVWQIDNVRLGERSCAPQPAGLVVGWVTDANTEEGMNGLWVEAAGGSPSAKTKATPDDSAVGDGYYTLVAPAGDRSFSTHASRYTDVTKEVTLTAHRLTRVDLPLPAGRLEVSDSVERTVTLGGSATASVTLSNTGGAPAQVTLNEASGRFSLLSAPSDTPRRVAATTSKHSLVGTTAPARTTTPLQPTAGATDWVYGPSTPLALADNLVGSYDGKVYTVGGVAVTSGGNVMFPTDKGYVLDPHAGGWKPIAKQPSIRGKANGAFIGGKFYVTGGWSANRDGSITPGMDVYDPRTDTWSSATPAPVSHAASGVSVLDGKLYVVGGCADECGSQDVWVYAPSTDRWQKAASYPEPTSWLSCGTITGQVYCAGGTTETQSSRKTFVYDPVANSWTRKADMPGGIWGSSYSAANGLLIVSGGATGYGWINMENYAYDAAADAWFELPTFTAQPTYRGGGACGFYTVGGGYGEPGWLTRILPGFDVCDEGDASWLSLDTQRLTVQPGESVTVKVTLDSGTRSVTQPGDLTGEIAVASDTPYRVAPVGMTMRVEPPRTWGKVGGTVTGVDCDGVSGPLAGSLLRITTADGSHTLYADHVGRYGLWLDRKHSPLTVTATGQDFKPESRTVKVRAGETSTADIELTSSLCVD